MAHRWSECSPQSNITWIVPSTVSLTWLSTVFFDTLASTLFLRDITQDYLVVKFRTILSFNVLMLEGFRGLPWWLRWSRICLQCKRPGFSPWGGGSPGEGNGNVLQCSCPENSMDRGAWWATVLGVAKSWTQPSDFDFTFSLPWLSSG